MALDKLKFPIGEFEKPKTITKGILTNWISTISEFPERLKNEVSNLTDVQLDTPYRSDGWTIRQVVHHCADSHMNSLIRFKLSLTEDCPTIKPYFEDRWAELVDSKTLPVASSLKILEGLHMRWTTLLNSLTDQQLKRTFIHPEHGRHFMLDETIGVYAWHCNHHLAHITTLKQQESWETTVL
jgi:hypothetical protein